MTLVGKLLVVVNLVFAIVFLTFSVVVFNTTTNWKVKVEAQKKQINDLEGTLRSVKADSDKKDKDLAQLKNDHAKQIDDANKRIQDLKTESDTRQREITDARSLLETAQANAKNALTQANLRLEESNNLRDLLRQVQKQANQFKETQRDLQEKIQLLTRDLGIAVGNNAVLRERATALSAKLRANNLTDDVVQYAGARVPPDVQGQVARVDPKNKRVEITLGSDEGLVVGDTLYVYRDKPTAEYLGKVRLILVEPDQAVGTIEGQTVGGKKIKEGDHVTTQIRPRS